MDRTFSQFVKQYDDDYRFHDIIDHDDTRPLLRNSEGFSFNGFTSMTNDWWLLSRDAPTPSEKEITYDVPYKQGVEDFSDLDGVRYFDMREISYQLVCVDPDYSYRREKAQYIKRALMETGGYHDLDDTDHPGFEWLAKCTSVSIDDSEDDGTVTATVKFSAYPYAYARSYEGSDIWDEIEFDHWISQDVKFTGSGTFSIQNIGSKPVECQLRVSSNYSVTGDGINGSLNVTPQNQDTVSFALPRGKHSYKCSTSNGNATIQFLFKREELI